MSHQHPIIAVTGSSGAGTTTTSLAFRKIFQQFDLRADGLWRQMKLLARSRHTASTGRDPEIPQMLEIHRLIRIDIEKYSTFIIH